MRKPTKNTSHRKCNPLTFHTSSLLNSIEIATTKTNHLILYNSFVFLFTIHISWYSARQAPLLPTKLTAKWYHSGWLSHLCMFKSNSSLWRKMGHEGGTGGHKRDGNGIFHSLLLWPVHCVTTVFDATTITTTTATVYAAQFVPYWHLFAFKTKATCPSLTSQSQLR